MGGIPIGIPNGYGIGIVGFCPCWANCCICCCIQAKAKGIIEGGIFWYIPGGTFGSGTGGAVVVGGGVTSGALSAMMTPNN